MGKIITWPILRSIQRSSMILTLGCCIYVAFFLFLNGRDNPISRDSSIVPATVLASAPLPYKETGQITQVRDIFALASDSPSGDAGNTPEGQLPAHLKIVGILIAHPSQIIIENDITKETYFIDEEGPKAGIRIVGVSHGQMSISYQGHKILVTK